MNVTTMGAVRDFSATELTFLQGLADQAALAIANARLLRDAQSHLRKIQSLREIDMAIAASFDLGITLDVILDQTISLLEVHAADILLLNPKLHTLEFAGGRGFVTAALQYTQLRLGESYAGRAALERRTVHIPDLSLRGEENGLLRSPLFGQEGFITYFGIPLLVKGEVKGVLEIFHRAPLHPDQDWLDFLEALARQAAIAIDNASLFDGLQRSHLELSLAYDTTLDGWAHAMELRDMEVEDHSQRVTEMTMRLARAMGLEGEALVHIRRGALLHDMGKLGVPDTILLKPGELTDEEWNIMRQHPQFAFDMLSPIKYLRPALDIPYGHHERWDGSGYPRGLKGEQIPLAARIFAVVDVFDALTSARPYREAWSREEAIEYIREQAGKLFDPQVVEAFLAMVEV
ncbi:MAG: HD domain-containing phosphohydrolase [Chloroflexota bacterium]